MADYVHPVCLASEIYCYQTLLLQLFSLKEFVFYQLHFVQAYKEGMGQKLILATENPYT
jgi:hypothetical protein